MEVILPRRPPPSTAQMLFQFPNLIRSHCCSVSHHLIMRVFIKKWWNKHKTVEQFKSQLLELLAVWS